MTTADVVSWIIFCSCSFAVLIMAACLFWTALIGAARVYVHCVDRRSARLRARRPTPIVVDLSAPHRVGRRR